MRGGLAGNSVLVGWCVVGSGCCAELCVPCGFGVAYEFSVFAGGLGGEFLVVRLRGGLGLSLFVVVWVCG